ncbi:uncharacterized protein LOC106092475 isoform X3 [Stomoxys calcitrans]|uniref:uncharacterized protein LOC106092475 isoform X3 n=1 Tax=Stomoxys calcitrans TaxID=35570 RepID=UPI0027E3A33C|nr:uncharacterized protein LOC106092475 isoform X3 [Stomoxys calcitrans]
MSSYRSSYTSYKSSLPSSTYKSGSSTSSYSPRDEISSSTSRYPSTAYSSPTAYRPSFSGGTYRVKRETPVAPAPTYVSRYTPISTTCSSSSNTLSKADSTTGSGLGDLYSMKPSSQLKRYGSTCSSLGKYSREPSPAALEHTNRIRSRDPSPVMRSIRAASRDPSPGLDSKYKLGNYGSGNSYRMNMPKAAATTPSSPYNARYGAARTPSSSSLGEKSSLYGGGGVGGGVGSSATRTPSCTSLAEKSSTSYGMAASKRTPSSTSLADKTTSYGNSSTKRTPSSSSLADKSSAYGSASARRTPSSTSLTEKSSAYSSSSTKHSQSPTPKGDRTPAYNPSSPSSTRKAQPSVRRTPSSTSISEKSSSERTSSDHQQPARCLSKPKMFQPSEKEKEIAKPNETPPTPQLPAIVIHEEENQLEESDTTEEDESDTSEDDELEEPAELFLAVSVCNRGTSPNPPGNRAMNMQTKNAADIAGTVEKTILRSTKKRKMLEKEMQSERVDDASKYTKYAYNSRLSPLSPRSDRYSPSNLRYSSSPLSSTPSKSSSLSTNEDSRREDSTTSSGSPVRSPKSPLPKSKLSPPRAGRLKSRQSSMESLSPNKPPMGPKGESPLKLSSPNASSLCLGGSKIPNKDFRKSSLNVGPTERTARKSRTPSTGNDSDFNTIEALNGALQAIQRLERSPSAGSEVSNASSRSLRSRNLNESKLRQRCLGKPLGSRTPPSPLSRQNSGTNLKQRTPMIASPLAARSTKIMVAPVTSSSSGNDSSGEIKKTHKKVAKKKMAKEVANSVSSTSCSISLSSSSSGGGGGGGGGNNDSDNQSSNAAKRQLPQPKVVVVAPSTTPVTATPSTTTTLESVKASKKSESSALKKSSSNSLRPDKDPLRRLKKLSSVSNFFVTQQKVTNSDDQIYLESTETSGGGSSSAGGGAEGGADGGGGATSTSTDLDLPSSKSSSKKSISLTRANETKTSKLAKPSNCSTSASNSNSPVHFAKSSTASEPHLSSATTKTSSKSSKTSASKSKTKSKSRSASVNASSTTSGSHNDSAEMPTDQRTESVSPYLATTTATTTTTNVTTSTGGTDSEEASWWQDTSQQIDTSSALDCSFKDEMRFKVRHVDSGETAWWLRNDDNEAEEVEEEENDITTDVFDENGVNTNDPTTNYRKDIALSELDYKAQEGCYYEESAQDTIDGEVRQFPRSHLTPETDWWNDDNGEGEQEEQTSAEQEYAIATAPPKQTQTIQLKICRVESGEIPWWQQQEEEEEEAENQQDISQPEGEAAEEDDQVITFEAQRPQDTTEPSSTASSSADHNKKWWLSGPSKKLFSIPRVESGEKAWWQVDNSDKESKRSKSQDPVQQQQQQTTEQTPPPPQVANPQNTRFQMPRVESGEKAWWLAESSDKDEKRSKSREPERWKDSRSPSSRQSQSPIKKLFNLTRVDADHEEEAWWQSEPNERGKTRSRSRDSDQWSNGRHRSRPDQRQHSSTPPAEHAKQPMWFESPRSSESPVKRVFTQQQSLEEQKERWLEERNRQYQQEQAAQEVYRQSQQIHATDNQKQWPELPSQRSHEYEEEPEEEEEEEEEEESHHHHQPQTSFMPSNRADSQTELSNSFNFEYSERPPPLGQCASPVQNEEEVVAAATAATRREPYCSSPYDNIPMTKVQQQTMAMGSTASVATTNLMPILGATTPPPAPPTNNTKPAHLAYNNNNNANNASHIYQQEHLNQQQQQQQQQQNSTSPPLVHQQHYYSTPSPPHTSTQQRPQPQPAQYNNNELRATNGKLFISRHQNIDELLSGSCRPLSPLFFENDNGSFQTMPTQRNMFLGEITPDQVRIHDSTAQMPHIQRMDSRDEWDRDTQRTSNARTPPRFEQKTIDDAAIQVYKDGDYGAYLDLESSLAEQAEEIEGLNSSRKNSLVVRTQLSVRVHAIIEKLLSAEGSDLRRALFSLKQVFQEDKDLVHAFVALGGLNCLVRVGNGADQNYQNYILRALGQVMLYVDGMNGVMKHEPTMQWLYSLIASNYRSVVKTALKLLLVFVEYAESNCHVLVSAIHSVDKQQGTLPWSNIMRLLKDYDNADAELVIYAASLINKTLGGLNDQDSFYDESDLLEQQGMESVIQHYMSKTGTDIDLINQLQLYEAVLKFEDGESDGLRLPDNTLRKTQRFRNSTDTAERRKSRRHSTGTSPGNINKVLPTAARLTPNQPALDEDSSSSTNSAEFGNGVFADKNHRDAAGVTPGLRRRRERAERHRSFLKEQQEAAAAAVAAANGYLNGLEKREELGQLVTAIPATIKNIDSPPESLTIIPESNADARIHNNSNGHVGSHGINAGSPKHPFNNLGNSGPAAAAAAVNPNNIALLINTNAAAINTPNNSNTNNAAHNNNTNHHINLLSPTKQLLGTNTISIINNSFDKSNINKLQQQQNGHNNKKNLFMERNAINGMKKNIHRNQGNGVEPSEHHNNSDSNLLHYKKFESNTNRLNCYYNQFNNSTPKNQNQNQHHSNSNHHQSPSPLSPSVHVSPIHQHPQSPAPIASTPLCVPSNSSTKSAAASALAAVLSPKKSLNCSSPSATGFDFTPKTSPSIVSPGAVAAVAKQLFQERSSHETLSPQAYTTSSSGCSTTPQTSPGEYPPSTPSNAYNVITNTSVAPPPPPPPPPPPDLFGFLRPMNFYQNNNSNNQNTTTSTTGLASSTANNFSNNPNNINNTNNSNSTITNSDAVDFLKISESESEDRKRLPQLKRDHTVKDLTQKLSNLPTSPTHEDKLQTRIVGDMSGLISKAKEGLAKSKSKGEVSRASSVDQEIKKPEPKKSENELQWEEVVRNMVRPLQLCDLDFTDLNSDDEKDILAPRGIGRGVPPPPPPMGGVALPPPMMPTHIVLPPPMMSQSNTSNGSAGFGSSLTNSLNSSLNGSINGDTIKKNKKTVKLFWKEVREDLIPVAVGKTIWDELPAANVDTQKLEHLFESRAKDLMTKEKQQEMNKSKEVIVLDHKRSNAINIAMTKLPPPRAIKAAILKMDATVVTREGIDKLLNMLPTEEEKGKIQEAQMANPELPLGSAEQFLLTLASISELAARLRLWAFRLDFDNSEKEIAEPLMDLKHGIEILRNNPTFKCILSTLLSVGIFLNGAPVKGFQIEYLAKVPEVKDTVHKHSLLHHLCHIVMESGMETTDLYSEIGPITRASKADFNDLAYNLSQLENECKASWDRLKLMCKHDCPPQLQQKLVDFLADCAERIIILQIVHRRVMNRYRKFLLWLGVPQHSVADSRPNEFCRILSEFALEYRTTRERVQQQIEKKANHRERNKTRGKLIVDIAKFKTKEDKQDAELKELLGTPSADSADGTLTWRRRRAENLRSPQMRQSEENFTDGDDEILESLVKTATKAPGNRTTPRERKRTRHADRKSCFCFDTIHDEHSHY